ncbi:MAG: UDP-glucose/GDP-mannose dehydrogenase family protein [Akkermansia sp.]|nr:UDP-glucose/GDP-mannose dehydrogenase family protein [Akkermansia sp.]
MNIAMVGTGYVGLVSGTCFAEMGNTVTCVDVNEEKIENLKQGIMPIYEPGLAEMVRLNAEAGRLHFTTSLAECLDDVDVVFSAVGTPPDEDGSADLRYVLEVAREFGRNIKKYTLLVTKSTVPVGTWGKVKGAVQEELDNRGVSVPFSVASNPEFLKEGTAIEDFMRPDRVVVGVEDEAATKLMRHLYRPFMLTGDRIQVCDIPSAEMIKYAANSMLATRISFMNDIANLCELVGANVDAVRRGIGSDERIGKKFLYPGCGYGGSCFPKDVKALICSGAALGYRMRILEAVEEVNERQKQLPFAKLKDAMPELKDKTVAVWGLAFKPGTDDMREAPSMVLIESLLEAGCQVRAFDPIATAEARRRLGDTSVVLCSDMYEACLGADALVIVTDWKQFRVPSWAVLRKTMRGRIIVDGRNLYEPAEAADEGFVYKRMG